MVEQIADFDAFFAERRAQAAPGVRLRLFDQEYELPTETPLAYVLLAEANRDRSDIDSLRQVLEPLFGADAIEAWAKQGMGEFQFQTVVRWASQNMVKPHSMSIEEAAEAVAKPAAGKAQPPNREARRLAERKKKPLNSGARS